MQYLLSPEGDIYHINNLKSFIVERDDLFHHRGHLNKIRYFAQRLRTNMKNQYGNHMGWLLFDHYDLADSYSIISPTDVTYSGVDLFRFIKESPEVFLHHGNLTEVRKIYCKIYLSRWNMTGSYNWRWNKRMKERIQNSKKNTIEFKIISPDGILYAGNNLLEFVRKHTEFFDYEQNSEEVKYIYRRLLALRHQLGPDQEGWRWNHTYLEIKKLEEQRNMFITRECSAVKESEQILFDVVKS